MLQPNNAKLDFSRTMTDESKGFITSSMCHNYGIMSGCDEGCPSLLNGECEVPNEAIKACDVDEIERKEILRLYA